MSSNHFHNTYELFYLIEGERRFFINDSLTTIRKGDLVLIQPNILHKSTSAVLSNYERFAVYFDVSVIKPYLGINSSLDFLLNNEYVIISLSEQEQILIEDLFNNLINDIKKKANAYELSLLIFLLQMLTKCCRCPNTKTPSFFKSKSTKHSRIMDIALFINNNYYKKLTLQFLSNTFFISQFYLSRVFKETTGFTISEYINNVRIKEAVKLLQDTKLNVRIISSKVGFGSITHFGRVFKETTGNPPLYYRKKKIIP